MRSTNLTLQMFAGMVVLAIVAGRGPNAQTIGPQVTTLLKTDAAGVEGKEWNVITVELVPGVVDARHSYLGVELVYVLEGAGFLEVDGKPPVALNPGVVAALNPKQINIVKNTSQTRTLKVLLVLLLKKGQQPSMLANGVAQGHKDGLQQIPNADLSQQKTIEHNNSTGTGLVF